MDCKKKKKKLGGRGKNRPGKNPFHLGENPEEADPVIKGDCLGLAELS